MNQLEIIKSKIFTKESIKSLLSIWNFKGQKIVFTNGCFDLLHLGHIDYLSKAADLGDILIIGLNTDKSTLKLKGSNRPIVDENSRAMLLASLRFVDAVILFEEETPYELIKFIQPDVLVKGSDYKAEDIVGFNIVKAKGGTVETIDFLEGYSTSAIEEKIRKQ
ncbi:MAG: D-glycero-beta-D-manno-heptose 1-phosphate adenylyltransferase [Saprospiraceae bacterium]|nr:D-glycero-beta-D-manno-heptose 1-phosphate adenylyltransferase [Saprospiraceae bacterium]